MPRHFSEYFSTAFNKDEIKIGENLHFVLNSSTERERLNKLNVSKSARCDEIHLTILKDLCEVLTMMLKYCHKNQLMSANYLWIEPQLSYKRGSIDQ